ncbi:MAG: AAA family ATPase [Planctomycetia bacterium]|nr:AAA family ATPase [Planctomycetia bacterium]
MSRKRPPRVVVLGGPNGAGKSTCAPNLLRGPLGVAEFVNADVIARGLSAFAPERVSWAAGRIMMSRLRELAGKRASFAFESTLASRTFAPWLKQLIAADYEFRLVFLWLPSADMAVARVAERVRLGGHDVPEEIVRRRYRSGLINFFSLYHPLASEWKVIDNSDRLAQSVIAAGEGPRVKVRNAQTWRQMRTVAELETP